MDQKYLNDILTATGALPSNSSTSGKQGFVSLQEYREVEAVNKGSTPCLEQQECDELFLEESFGESSRRTTQSQDLLQSDESLLSAALELHYDLHSLSPATSDFGSHHASSDSSLSPHNIVYQSVSSPQNSFPMPFTPFSPQNATLQTEQQEQSKQPFQNALQEQFKQQFELQLLLQQQQQQQQQHQVSTKPLPTFRFSNTPAQEPLTSKFKQNTLLNTSIIDDGDGPETSRLSRTEREKLRQQTINSGFDTLKEIVPGCSDLKISRATILKRCIVYLQNMQSAVGFYKIATDQLKSENVRLQTENTRLNAIIEGLLSKESVDFANNLLSTISGANASTVIATSTSLFKHQQQSEHPTSKSSNEVSSEDSHSDDSCDLSAPLNSKQRLGSIAPKSVRSKKQQKASKVDMLMPRADIIEPGTNIYVKDSTRILLVLCVFFLIFPTWGMFTSIDSVAQNSHAQGKHFSNTGRMLNSLEDEDHKDSFFTLLWAHVPIPIMYHLLLCMRCLGAMLLARIILLALEPVAYRSEEVVEQASLLRKAGVCAYKDGRYEDAHEHFVEALSTLGNRYTFSSTWRNALNILIEIGHHQLSKWKIGRWVDRIYMIFTRQQTGNANIELAHIYHGIHLLECFHHGREKTAIYSALKALNHAEAFENTFSGQSPLLTQIYASMAFIYHRIFPQFNYITRHYSNLVNARVIRFGESHSQATDEILQLQRSKGNHCQIRPMPGLLIIFLLLVACTLCQFTSFFFSTHSYSDSVVVHNLMILPTIILFPIAVLTTAP